MIRFVFWIVRSILKYIRKCVLEKEFYGQRILRDAQLNNSERIYLQQDLSEH